MSKPKLIYLCLALCLSGCATVPYRYGVDYIDPRLPAVPFPVEAQIVRGRPNRFLDASDWIWPGSWLGKLILWDRRVDNHKIGDETESVMQRYLAANELGYVKVRLNAYHVRDEWRRLRSNRSVGAGWRYTLGVLGWLQYTILPGRFFGGDHYNPYSNTINLYSDIPAIAVHEGGHAKDFAARKWKGTYAVIYIIPLVNLCHEALASNDALGYLRADESPALQYEGYRIMHPAYGSYLGYNFGLLFPAYDLPIALGMIAGGHITGRVRGSQLPPEIQ
jgi:hypothetical protein